MQFHIGSIARPELVILISFLCKTDAIFLKPHIFHPPFSFVEFNLQRECASIISHAGRFEGFYLASLLARAKLAEYKDWIRPASKFKISFSIGIHDLAACSILFGSVAIVCSVSI